MDVSNALFLQLYVYILLSMHVIELPSRKFYLDLIRLSHFTVTLKETIMMKNRLSTV